MPLSKTGHVHLIYQFIILTMLVIFIGYDELLSERKYVYLSIISLFLTAMVILSCYTELLPAQKWISQYYSSANSTKSIEQIDTTSSEQPNKISKEETGIEQDDKTESLHKLRVYRFRNWKKNGPTEKSSIKKSSSIFDASSIVPMENIGDYNFGNCVSKESDLTKRYYFPFRQKRLEEWVDSKESRPHKIRPWETNIQNNTNSTNESFEVSSTKNIDQPTSPTSPSDLGIPKSYSFPFRRKRLEHWMEIQENEKMNLEITSSLPQWESMDYSEDYPEFRMRRSLSGSALNSEELDLPKYDKEKDFSQSVEVTRPSNEDYSNNPTSPSKTIDKIKAGFKDYFFKMRKESFKGNLNKGAENKRRAFKSFFQSKENVSINASEKNRQNHLL